VVEEAFAELTGSLDYSMLIVTASAGGEPSGCLVGFATQCSIEPPRFLVCLSVRNHTHAVASEANELAVHFPSRAATEIVELFGEETGDRVDKFTRCEWRRGPRELPLLAACPRWFAGEILDRVPLGDHTAFVLAPFAAEAPPPADGGFPFRVAKRMDPGHEP
jgi:flavin reductase (DIM6/NTAB) family NADH-FMN oxidoreductase RutF